MDNWWTKVTWFFIHRLPTRGGHTARDVLVGFLYYKLLILLGFIKLCTGKAALNNNNNISISNIY